MYRLIFHGIDHLNSESFPELETAYLWGLDITDNYGEFFHEHNALSGGVVEYESNQRRIGLNIRFYLQRNYPEQPFVEYGMVDYLQFCNTFYFNKNEETQMENAPVMSNELLKVKTFADLMAVRSLTGIMRLNEHHFNNGLSTFLLEKTFTINSIDDAKFSALLEHLENINYLVEVRTNTERNKTCNAYKVADGIVQVAVVLLFEDNKLRYYGYSSTKTKDLLQETLTHIQQFVKEEPIVVNYVTGFNDQGAIVDHREINGDRNIPVDAFYPFIEEGIEALSEGFINSNSNLLLLVGERGTGKTTLLREFCRRYKAGQIYQMCGDKVILHPAFDSYLASLPEKSLVIIEDADAILGKRTDQNTSLSMLLNELDGIANKGSKFVITTNLENLKSVDTAVLRVGRCYKTIAFRKLTGNEANVVADKLQFDHTFDNDITLAEVFNGANQKVVEPVGFRPIGQ